MTISRDDSRVVERERESQVEFTKITGKIHKRKSYACEKEILKCELNSITLLVTENQFRGDRAMI
jgi:hypothetical protein